jgi:cystathionine beta-lyase/cystathionine gamma-synthase
MARSGYKRARLACCTCCMRQPPSPLAAAARRHVTLQERAAAGISEGLIRVAVGIEDTADLVADFVGALDALGPAAGGSPPGS